MRKWTILLLTAALALSLSACGGGNTPPADSGNAASNEGTAGPDTSATPEAEEPETLASVTTTDYMTIDGICVDDSYQDEDGSPLKMVYLLYTLTAPEENLQIDSTYTTLTINDANSYESEHDPSAPAIRYMPNYYYSSYIEAVYMGTSLQVAATFLIPEADLAPGRSITLSDSQIPDVDKIRLSTDDIEHFGSSKELAQAMDPDGYETVMVAYEEADAETTAQVKELINGYYWQFYVNNTAYELEFWAENNFEVRTSLGTSNSGTYSVRNGYLFCTYPDTGYTIEIPYEFADGDISLDLTDAFDVRG